MGKEPLTITVDPASELAHALAETEAPIVLVSSGVRFTVEREDIFAGHDERAVLRGLRQSRGALSGVNTEALLEDLTEQRSQNPARRPF